MYVSTTLSANTQGKLRPLNVIRDLSEVADLIELCFHTTLDADGRSYIRQMRRSSTDSMLPAWMKGLSAASSMPLSGFVWDVGGKIVGNVSMVPFRKNGQKVSLLANIAVHPNYRRRGIARLLTETAMQHARERASTELWLHVRDDNPGAVSLYEKLGFTQRFLRSSWSSGQSPNLPVLPPAITILPRKNKDWDAQNIWLNNAYPEDLRWYSGTSWGNLAPGLWPSLLRTFSDTATEQISAYEGKILRAVIAVKLSNGRNTQAWIAAPRGPSQALTGLLIYARQMTQSYQSLIVDYPGGEHVEALQAAGFTLNRSLIWMQAPGKTQPE